MSVGDIVTDIVTVTVAVTGFPGSDGLVDVAESYGVLVRPLRGRHEITGPAANVARVLAVEYGIPEK